MDVRFNLDKLFEEEHLNEGPIGASEEIKVQEGLIFIMLNEGNPLEEECTMI